MMSSLSSPNVRFASVHMRGNNLPAKEENAAARPLKTVVTVQNHFSNATLWEHSVFQFQGEKGDVQVNKAYL